MKTILYRASIFTASLLILLSLMILSCAKPHEMEAASYQCPANKTVSQSACGTDMMKQEAMRESTSTRPLPKILEFSAEYCPPCREMKPIIAELKEKYAGKVDIVPLDLKMQREEFEKYNIEATPTMVFFDTNGKEVYRHEGSLEKEKLDELIKEKFNVE